MIWAMDMASTVVWTLIAQEFILKIVNSNKNTQKMKNSKSRLQSPPAKSHIKKRKYSS